MLNINTVVLVLVGLVVILISNWIRKWRNPKSNGILPPGSMGFPLIGETLSLIIPSYSLDLHPFVKSRFQRYGTISKTSIAGRSVIISVNQEFNNYLLQHEGRLVELYYFDFFSKIFGLEGESRTNVVGSAHKYIRTIFLNHFGAERLKEQLISQIELSVNKNMHLWSTQSSVEIKHSVSNLVLDVSAKQMFSSDAENLIESLSEIYTRIRKGFMSFPINIPGTAYHQCLKDQNRITTMFRGMLNERLKNLETCRRDLLDQISRDMGKEKYLSEDFIVQLLFGTLFATFESVSIIIALAFKLLSEHPSVIEEMMAEHELILKNREDPNFSLTWEEYKSMTFTHQVIKETLRLGSIAPWLLRKTLKDIRVEGFTIPKDWIVVLVISSPQLSPNIFENPLEFNPWRWKELEPHVVSKNFMPFGGGIRQCAGAEYSRVFMAIFFHVLLTKYRWEKVKMGNICRSPMLGFGKGIHIKFSQK